jgi:hypothetical protein
MFLFLFFDIYSSCKNGKLNHAEKIGLSGKESDLHSEGAHLESQ